MSVRRRQKRVLRKGITTLQESRAFSRSVPDPVAKPLLVSNPNPAIAPPPPLLYTESTESTVKISPSISFTQPKPRIP